MTLLPETLIDGALHPELVPDVSAYRLWFLAVSLPPSGATDSQRAVQRAQLGALQLDDADYGVMVNALASFNGRYADLVTDHNATVSAAAKSLVQVDRTSFLSARDSLVNGAVADLSAQLSPGAFDRFRGFIQGEKKHMRLSPVNK